MAKRLPLPCKLYANELIHKGRGYPFWYPEPDSSAPDEFKERGIHPGDVGIINNDGGFDFLFSIYSDTNGLITGHTLSDFRPLPQPTQREVQVHPVHGNVLKSQHVSDRGVSVDVSAPGLQGIANVGMRFDVRVSEVSAAILLLPDNSTRYKDLRKAAFEEYARRYGVSWYRYADGLSRGARRGSLYLITECDKTTTWGNAVIGRKDRRFEFSLECALKDVGGITINVANSWINDADIENGLFPMPTARYSYPRNLQNQCIFARGFTISLSESLFKKSKAVPHPIDGSSKDRIPSFDRRNAPLPQSDGKMGGQTSRFSLFGSKTPPKDSDFDQSRMLVESADDELLVAEVSEFPTAENEPLNPSAAMNEYLLSKVPSLEIAITHDDEWMEVMQQYEVDTYLSEEELWSKLKDSLDAKISMLSSPVGVPSNMTQDMTSSPPKYSLPRLNPVDGSRFWAVIIGINGYKTSPLRGCVSDAEMVAKYLIDDLLVPESNIQLLLGTESTGSKEFTVPGNKPLPTRANIVNAILGLSTNPNIQHGDNIIIYFAGHGTTYECDKYFGYKDGAATGLGTVDALCPIDRCPEPTASAKIPSTDVDDIIGSITSDPQVPDISDREINTILAEIARKKGNHITFILDCCYSGRITREPMPQEGVRSITPLPPSSIPHMFSAADETLKDLDGYQSISAARWRPNMDTHVVLAACKEYEKAKEVNGDDGLNGVFTQALISAFKSANLNDKPMTYYKLLATLPENPTQHPVIAGKHRRSRLWFQDHDSDITASSD